MQTQHDPDEGVAPCEHTAWLDISTKDDAAHGITRFLCEICGSRFIHRERSECAC